MAVDLTKGSAAVPFMQDRSHRFQLYSEIVPTIAEIVDANVLQCLKVKAGMRVCGVTIQIVSAGTGTATLTGDVGDGADTDGWSSAAAYDLKAAVKTVYQSVPADDYSVLGGKLYIADDTIDVLLALGGGTVTAAVKFRIWADCEYVKDFVV